jgi:hypothetical protein
MRIQRVLGGIVVACGLAGSVQADTLLSGPVYGGLDQDHVACQVVNAGTAPITFVTTDLLGQYVSPLPLNYNDCLGRPLLPGAICSFQAATVDHQATACKVIIREAKTNVRGTMVALSGPDNVNLSEADLR